MIRELRRQQFPPLGGQLTDARLCTLGRGDVWRNDDRTADDRITTRDGRFGSKVGQIGPQIGQIRDFFISDFSTFGSSSQMY